MAIIQTVVAQQGPLPIKNQFQFEAQGDIIVFVSGSGWSSNAGQNLGIVVYIDGVQVAVCNGFTNEASSHKTLVPVMVPYNLPYAASHTVTVEPVGYTTTDINDFFNVTLIY